MSRRHILIDTLHIHFFTDVSLGSNNEHPTCQHLRHSLYFDASEFNLVKLAQNKANERLHQTKKLLKLRKKFIGFAY